MTKILFTCMFSKFIGLIKLSLLEQLVLFKLHDELVIRLAELHHFLTHVVNILNLFIYLYPIYQP